MTCGAGRRCRMWTSATHSVDATASQQMRALHAAEEIQTHQSGPINSIALPQRRGKGPSPAQRLAARRTTRALAFGPDADLHSPLPLCSRLSRIRARPQSSHGLRRCQKSPSAKDACRRGQRRVQGFRAERQVCVPPLVSLHATEGALAAPDPCKRRRRKCARLAARSGSDQARKAPRNHIRMTIDVRRALIAEVTACGEFRARIGDVVANNRRFVRHMRHPVVVIPL